MPEPFSEQNVLHSWELQFCQRIVPLLAALSLQHDSRDDRLVRCVRHPVPRRVTPPRFYRPAESAVRSLSGAPSAISTTPASSSTLASHRATSRFKCRFRCLSSVPGSPATLCAPPAGTQPTCPRRNSGTDSRHPHGSRVRARFRPSSSTIPSSSISARTNSLLCPRVWSVTGALNVLLTASSTGPTHPLLGSRGVCHAATCPPLRHQFLVRLEQPVDGPHIRDPEGDCHFVIAQPCLPEVGGSGA